MSKRKVLGKGLSALIPDAAVTASGGGGNLVSITVDEISPNRFQPRREFDDVKIEELAASIREKGIIQPLIVRETDEGYELIAGERRLRAAKLAGLASVPAVIRDVSDGEALELALIENIQRENLNPIEEAQAYQRLIEEFSLTQEEMGQKVGRDRTTITNSLRLLTLPQVVRNDLAAGNLSSGHGRALLALGDERQILIARERFIAKGMSVREAEAYVKRIKEGEGAQKEKPEIDPAIYDIEEDLTRTLGTKVRIVPKGAGGSIVIEYYSEQELDRLAEILRP
jgi:ParB family transcriptional regulator, chromosome partitioning protein